MIRRQNRDVAVIISAEEYERVRKSNIAKLEELCDRVSKQAAERDLTEEILADILKD